MKLRTLLLIIFLPITAAAQFTTVTGTVTDPSGIPYAGGTIQPQLIVPSGAGTPTLGGFAYSPPQAPTGLDTTGSFVVNLGDNGILLPAGTKWNFLVCSAKGTVQPAGGKGPVCFTLAAPITITGAAQSITANLAAVPPPSLAFGGGGGGTIGGSIAANQIAVGSAANTINGFVNFTATTPAASVVNGTVTAGVPGSVGGVLAAAGATSGTVTCTAPAVAGTSSNPLVCSNALSLPSTVATNSLTWSTGSLGLDGNGPVIKAQTFQSSAVSGDIIFMAGNSVIDVGGTSPALSDVTMNVGSIVSGGTKFTASGCANTSTVGGSSAGQYTSVTAGGCTVTITIGSPASQNGWVCDAHDITTVADANNVTMGTSTTTTANLVEGTIAANDVISFKCVGF